MEISNSVSLKPYNSLAVEAEAEFLATAKNSAELYELLKQARENRWPVTVLGGGTNILPIGHVKGLVILNRIEGIEYLPEKNDQILVKAGAGVMLDDLIADSVKKGYWGLENLSHIPGTVGATPVQNVGAYGVEVADLIKEVIVIDKGTGETETLNNQDCQFGYRDSYFKTEAGRNKLVISVTFALSSIPKPHLHYAGLKERLNKPEPAIQEIRDTVIAIRSTKFPDWTKVGTAGSFFKNSIVTESHYQELQAEYPDMPGFLITEGLVKVPLGWVLEHICDLRDYRTGNVGTYKGQALVIVNYGGATANDIKKFADQVAEKVFAKTKIKIEWEVTKIN